LGRLLSLAISGFGISRMSQQFREPTLAAALSARSTIANFFPDGVAGAFLPRRSALA
jgi:hypothetical protein